MSTVMSTDCPQAILAFGVPPNIALFRPDSKVLKLIKRHKKSILLILAVLLVIVLVYWTSNRMIRKLEKEMLSTWQPVITRIK